MSRLPVYILGGSGYGGGELLRLLSLHPKVGGLRAVSRKQAVLVEFRGCRQIQRREHFTGRNQIGVACTHSPLLAELIIKDQVAAGELPELRVVVERPLQLRSGSSVHAQA